MKSFVKSDTKSNEILKSVVFFKKEELLYSFLKNTKDFRISLFFVLDFATDFIGFQDFIGSAHIC